MCGFISSDNNVAKSKQTSTRYVEFNYRTKRYEVVSQGRSSTPEDILVDVISLFQS